MKIKVSKYVRDRIGRTKSDFEVQTFLCGGCGGQNLQKTSSGVRIIDKKTGLRTECREERDQLANKNRAFLRMVELLQAHYAAEELGLQEDTKVTEVVRTYNEKDNRVVDKRTAKQYDYRDILEGKLEKMIEDVQLECQE